MTSFLFLIKVFFILIEFRKIDGHTGEGYNERISNKYIFSRDIYLTRHCLDFANCLFFMQLFSYKTMRNG